MKLDPAGRYRPVRSSLWATLRPLTPLGRLTYLALLTGSTSNIAGIAFISHEAWARETGLNQGELASALAELSKKPTPSRSFIVADDQVVWVRDALSNAPQVLTEAGQFASDLHRKAVKSILGSLPSDSAVVKKFKNHYRLALKGPSPGVSKGANQGGAKVRKPTTETKDQRPSTEIVEPVGEVPRSPAAPPSPSPEPGYGGAGHSEARTPPPRGRYEELLADIKRQRPSLDDAEAGRQALKELLRCAGNAASRP